MKERHHRKRKPPRGKISPAKKLVIGAAALALAVVIGLVAFESGGQVATGKVAEVDESLRRGETRQTLNPSLFRHPTVRSAYEVAREIPWVLDSIYCYCFCEENPSFRHKSLLSCYVDNHAAG